MVFSAENFIRDLERMGFLDVILPFLLFFTILFAALQKTKVLSNNESEGRKYNAIIAFVVSLLIVIPHVVWGKGDRADGVLRIGSRTFPDAVEIINNSLPTISIWIVAILMFMLILGLFGANIKVMKWPLSSWVVIAAVVIVGYTFGSASGLWGDRNSTIYRSLGLNNPNNMFGIILILVFAVVLWLVVKEPPQTSKTGTPKTNPFKDTFDAWWEGDKNPPKS